VSAVTRARAVAGAVDPALWLLAFIGFISQVGISVMLPLLPLYAPSSARSRPCSGSSPARSP
jgi:hypothetical protein